MMNSDFVNSADILPTGYTESTEHLHLMEEERYGHLTVQVSQQQVQD